MKTAILLEMDATDAEAARALAVQRGISLAQLLSEALKNLVGPKPGYNAAKARALARLEHGYDLDWTPPASRDELHWDALIIQAASSAGARTLYSEDLSHNQVYGLVRVVNPLL
jgi:hypothetical protein